MLTSNFESALRSPSLLGRSAIPALREAILAAEYRLCTQNAAISGG
jgi:hypothetical protein